MFNLVLTYECDCSAEELMLHKKALLSGESYADVCAAFDDWYVTDTAIVELAVELGWDLGEAMKADWIELISQKSPFTHNQSLRRRHS